MQLKYKTKVIKVEAIQYNGNNLDKIEILAGYATEILSELKPGNYLVSFYDLVQIYTEAEFNFMFEKDYD